MDSKQPHGPTAGTNILPSIPGEHIARAAALLPAAATASAGEIREVVIEVPGHGLVRFECKRFSHKHGKSTFYSWLVTRATRQKDVNEPES